MSAYERVTYAPEGGRRRTVNLHQPAVVGDLLTGIEVNMEGDEIAPRGVDARRHLISLALVSARVPMVMDRAYGVLVPAGTETPR